MRSRSARASWAFAWLSARNSATSCASFWVKARAEESFLAAELGADAYAPYRRRVPMLLPRLWRH